MVVFGILNLVENLIHYNIGRSYSEHNGKFVFYFPDIHEFIKIIGVMIIFGIAQGYITEFFIQD